ncbi:MAG: hypothetical protein R2849_03895 [Thermomicrobiales bacterium]
MVDPVEVALGVDREVDRVLVLHLREIGDALVIDVEQMGKVLALDLVVLAFRVQVIDGAVILITQVVDLTPIVLHRDIDPVAVVVPLVDVGVVARLARPLARRGTSAGLFLGRTAGSDRYRRRVAAVDTFGRRVFRSGIVRRSGWLVEAAGSRGRFGNGRRAGGVRIARHRRRIDRTRGCRGALSPDVPGTVGALDDGGTASSLVSGASGAGPPSVDGDSATMPSGSEGPASGGETGGAPPGPAGAGPAGGGAGLSSTISSKPPPVSGDGPPEGGLTNDGAGGSGPSGGEAEPGGLGASGDGGVSSPSIGLPRLGASGASDSDSLTGFRLRRAGGRRPPVVGGASRRARCRPAPAW